VTSYRLDDSQQGRGKGFPLRHHIQTGNGTQPAFCPKVGGGFPASSKGLEREILFTVTIGEVKSASSYQLPDSSSCCGTKRVVVAVALSTCILEVLISNLARGTEYTDRFSWFSSSPPGKWSRNSAVGIATGYGLDGRRVRV
jgi:hypothetical protein